MTHVYVHFTRWDWCARTWRAQSAGPSEPIISKHEESFMKSMSMLLAISLLSLSACRTSANSDGTLFVSGRIDGDTVDISSKRPGRITEITVREGDSVQAGQVLAVLTSDQDQARFEAQEARVTSGQ